MTASMTESMRAGLEAVQKCKSAYGLCKGANVRNVSGEGGGHGHREFRFRLFGHQPREPGAGCRRLNS